MWEEVESSTGGRWRVVCSHPLALIRTPADPPPLSPPPHHMVLSLWSVKRPQRWISVMASILEVVSMWTDIEQWCTVRKMGLILRSIQRRPQIQFSMARRFKLQLLHRYSVKFSKMRNFTLGSPWLGKLKNTGGRRTNNLWICSLRLYPCATVAFENWAIFFNNINIFC